MNKQNYILWLPSWYPNELERFNGDFIQRHAKAAAMYNDVTVIFFTAFGEKVRSEFKMEEKQTGKLKELVVYVPFAPTGRRVWDRLQYNIRYYHFAHKFLLRYFKENGLPALVHVHVPVKAGNLAIWIKKKFGIAYIVSEHASTYLKEAPDNYFRRHFFYRQQVRKVFSGASMVINVSHAVLKILEELFALKKTAVIPNVVDTSLFYWSEEKNGIFTFIHVSGLNEQKNIRGILQTFRKLSETRSDWKLILVGPCTSETTDYILKEDLKSFIELTGEVSYAEVAQHMRRAHVKVLFSNHENFPCVVVEALCCGLPVVSSDVAGISEAVNETNGLLVKPRDNEALLQALETVMDHYHKYNSKQIAATAASRFRYAAIAAQFDEVYRAHESVGG